MRTLRQVFIIIVFLFGTALLYANQATEYIPASEYFEKTITEINNAKSSVQVFMYLISVFPGQPDSQSTQLLNALIKAKDRGVDIKVILDQNIDFQEEIKEEAIYQNKNQNAYELLRRNGIAVFFDEADTYTHAKAIVIDNETVILGSTNWSKAALTRNNETNALIRSKEFAKNLLNDLSKIQIQEVPAVITPTVSIPKDFLTKDKLLGEMVSQADERAFDTYLYLLSQSTGNPKLILNYDKLAASLGINQMTKEDYRRQINKVLEKLENKYKLIKFQNPERNQDAEVTLQDLPQDNLFQIPTTYWKYNWNKTLTFPAKVMLLITHSYTSTTSQDIYMSRETLSKNHHISESFITDGTGELKKLNLLDIKYGEIEGKSYSQRPANVYTPQGLYNPKDLEKDLKGLEEKYDQEKLTRAKQVAQIVFEENNPKTIKALIELEDKYGQATVAEAVKVVAVKNSDNPKRSAGYLINTVKSLSKSKDSTKPLEV